MTNRPVTESLDVGAREAVNDFFDALSKWRDEVASSTERYNETTLGKDGDCRYRHGLAKGGGRGVARLSRASLEDANAHDRSADGCLASAGEIAHV